MKQISKTIFRMILFLSIFGSGYDAYSQVSLSAENQTIRQIMTLVEKQSGYSFFFNKNLPDLDKVTSIRIEDQPLETVLKRLFEGTSISFVLKEGRQIVLTDKSTSSRQNSVKKTIRGTVKDSGGNPLPGVNVVIVGTTSGVSTDIDGVYSLEASPGDRLRFSFIGFRPAELTVSQSGDEYSPTLQEDTSTLDEVVVVGYGVQRKSDVTGSISVATSEDILRSSPTNMLDGLKGKAAGVNIFSNSGQPGGQAPKVLIRGMGTIKASSDPLYVVDGVVMGGIEFLNPNDIEHIEILKDASSTAIYGARGANGVILVTTKRGGIDEGVHIGYDGYVSLSHPQSKVDVMNSAEFMQAMELSYQNARDIFGIPEKDIPTIGKDPRLFDQSGNPLYDTDWQDETTRLAISHNHQLSVQYASKKSSVGAFLNYTDNQGVMKNTWFKRVNAKLTYDAEPTRWLSTGVNLLVNHSWQNKTEEDGGGQSPRRAMLEMPPIFPVRFPDTGKYSTAADTSDPFKFEKIDNPVHKIMDEKRNDSRTQVFGNAYLTFHLLPGLDLKTQFGVDARFRSRKEFSPNDIINTSQGKVILENYNDFYWQEETYLSFNRAFGKSRINSVLGLSWQANTSTNLKTNSVGFEDNFFGYNNIGAGTVPNPPSSNYGHWAMNSYFLRAAYSYDNRYMATFTARVDGSSKFGENNKYAFFPSLGLGWLVSNEKFMKNVGWISVLKLHASYGITGNSELGSYQSLSTFNSGTVLMNGALVPSSNVTRLANPDLEWEKTRQFDIGINWNLFDNRLNFDVSYYHKLTTDLLLDNPIPATTGFTSLVANVGSVSNQGVDFMVNTVNIESPRFRWESTLNFNYNKNRVEKLGENDADILPGPNWLSNSMTIIRVGEPLSCFYGYTRYGIFNEDQVDEFGKVIAYRGTPYRSENLDIIGNGLPDVMGSFINRFYYRNFDLTVDLQFSIGADILQRFFHPMEDRFGLTNGFKSSLYDQWTPENTDTMVPALRNATINGVGQSTFVDSHWVCDGSYLRVNSLQLGYNFDRKLLSKASINNVRLYFNVNNPFVIHSKDFKGLDPEGTSHGSDQWGQNIFFNQYPKPTTYTLGMNISF